ncbi:uncharacterized protein LOC113040279 [Carassius auratus]|uniref:Uncharacterized protein LOC113040279 n=1 Tax=Carassius auratus TaxID=7957 RepID=A0A6P6J4K2_CARAU|nr:uncharacterized protein LOC113040279 [Carassius auratus]
MLSVGWFAVSAFLLRGASGSDGVSVSVMEGDSVTLNTEVKRNHTEKINWYFDDTRIAQISGNLSYSCTDVQCNNGTERFRDRLKLNNQTGSLRIRNITITDSGKYILVIINGSDTEKIFNVTVVGVSAAERGEISVKEGENITLGPGVIKKPIDPMRWYFNDTLIVEITADQCKIWTDEQGHSSNERFRDRLEVNQTGSLTIKNTTNTDSGVYHLQINSGRFGVIRSFGLTVTGAAVQAPIRKVSVSGLASGIRVTVFRGIIDSCDLMKALRKGREDEK